MLRSVQLRENSHTLNLSLSELAILYLDMLKLDEADATSYRMLRDAHRYDQALDHVHKHGRVSHKDQRRVGQDSGALTITRTYMRKI